MEAFDLDDLSRGASDDLLGELGRASDAVAERLAAEAAAREEVAEKERKLAVERKAQGAALHLLKVCLILGLALSFVFAIFEGRPIVTVPVFVVQLIVVAPAVFLFRRNSWRIFLPWAEARMARRVSNEAATG